MPPTTSSRLEFGFAKLLNGKSSSFALFAPSTVLADALDRLNIEYRLREILQAEPRLQPILEQVRYQKRASFSIRVAINNPREHPSNQKATNKCDRHHDNPIIRDDPNEFQHQESEKDHECDGASS